MARRTTFDIFAAWLFFVALPAVVRLALGVPLWRFLWRRWRGQSAGKTDAGDFYRSAAWRKLRIRRMEANIKQYGRLTCELCFATDPGGAWHIHHVKSRSNFPELALELSNVVVLCEADNMGMSNDFEDLDLNRCQRKQAQHRRSKLA